MKTKLIFLAIVGSLLLVSCKKEVIYPSDQLPTKTEVKSIPQISRWGKFLVIGSRKMVTNTETGVKTYYDDFGNGSRSSLRWGGSYFEIEEIIKDTTTWSFYKPNSIPGDGNFILNSDTSKHYEAYFTTNYSSIIEDPNAGQQNMGGSARPFSMETVDDVNKIVNIYVETAYANINGDLCEYFTELKLKKIQEW